MRRLLLLFMFIGLIPVGSAAAQCDWDREIREEQRSPFTTRSLALVACPGSELPSSVTEIDNLTTLRVAGSDYVTLPGVVFQLTDLEFLQFNRGVLHEVPPDITRLDALTSLSLQDNDLTEFPLAITELSSLSRLDLSGNPITELPPEIANLTRLESLRLEDTQLTELPPEIGALTQLKTLSLEGSQLQTLPPEIGNLENLESLNLEDNDLRTLPREIGRLPDSARFRVDDNPNLDAPPDANSETVRRYYGDPAAYRIETAVNEARPWLVLLGQITAVGLAIVVYWRFLHGHPKRIAIVLAIIGTGALIFFIMLFIAIRALAFQFEQCLSAYSGMTTLLVALAVRWRRR